MYESVVQDGGIEAQWRTPRPSRGLGRTAQSRLTGFRETPLLPPRQHGMEEPLQFSAIYTEIIADFSLVHR